MGMLLSLSEDSMARPDCGGKAKLVNGLPIKSSGGIPKIFLTSGLHAVMLPSSSHVHVQPLGSGG
jgi:hypothetical protein